jgi:peptide chain release factor 2
VVDAMNATKTDIGRSHQIRSYVLQPCQIVKDLRTGIETSQSGKVLDRFLEASLAQRIKGAEAAEAGAGTG